MQGFLLTLFVALCLGFVRQALAANHSGCQSNVKDLFTQGVANGTDPALITCTDAIWTIPGDLELYSDTLNVYNETLNVAGRVNFGPVCTPFLPVLTRRMRIYTLSFLQMTHSAAAV
jgi:hypothetical protein